MCSILPSPTSSPSSRPLWCCHSRRLHLLLMPSVTAPSTDSTLVAALATVQAIVATARDCERVTTLAWKHEHTTAAALASQMVELKCLFFGSSVVVPSLVATMPPLPLASTPPSTPRRPVSKTPSRLFSSPLIRRPPTAPAGATRIPDAPHAPALCPRRPCPPSWYRMDLVVLSSILDTFTIELQDIVRERRALLARPGFALKAQFLDNREAHALHLDVGWRLGPAFPRRLIRHHGVGYAPPLQTGWSTSAPPNHSCC